MPSKEPFICAIVSGKGGVGKTTISANIAYIFSQIGKTLLVDFDIQNQGATGLFMPTEIIKSDCLSTYSLINGKTKGTFALISENLSFLPSTNPYDNITQLDIASLMSKTDTPRRVDGLFDFLTKSESFDFIVIDCHGGIDFLSLKAFINANKVLVITEFESVTFNGTLELLRFYYENIPDFNVNSKKNNQHTKLKILVNRLETNYKSHDILNSLSRVYDKSLHGALQYEIISLIPSEGIISRSFGEYPFFVEIAPSSDFSSKIRHVCYELLKDILDISVYTPGIGNMASEKFRKKVMKTVVSNSARMTNRLFMSFITSLFMIFIIMTVAGVLALFELFFVGQGRLYVDSLDKNNVTLIIYVTMFYLFLGILSSQFVVTGLSVKRYLQIEYEYRKNLILKTKEQDYTVVRLKLMMNRTFRIMIWFGIFFFALFAGLIALMVLGVVLAALVWIFIPNLFL